MIRVSTRTDMAKVIPPGGVGAELGVYCGKFSTKLLEYAKPKKLYLVDRWFDSPDFLGKKNGLNAAEAMRITKERTTGHPAAELVQADVLDWLSSQADNTLDWLYLDDTHTADHLTVELEWSHDKLKTGALLMVHDYCCALPQVVWSVDAFMAKHNYEFTYITNEGKKKVWPRLIWQPKRCAYNSIAITVRK